MTHEADLVTWPSETHRWPAIHPRARLVAWGGRRRDVQIGSHEDRHRCRLQRAIVRFRRELQSGRLVMLP